jgi:hypothetical protein
MAATVIGDNAELEAELRAWAGALVREHREHPSSALKVATVEPSGVAGVATRSQTGSTQTAPPTHGCHAHSAWHFPGVSLAIEARFSSQASTVGNSAG